MALGQSVRWQSEEIIVINTDILNWDYKMYEPEYFDLIWASPLCTEYSIAKTVGVRNIDYAKSIVLKILEIIDCLKPK